MVEPLSRPLPYVVLSVLCLASSLSGCLLEGEEEPKADILGQDPASKSRTGSASGNASSDGAPSIANLTTNITGLVVELGIVALDADGQNLTYTASFGDNATGNGSLARAPANTTGVPAGGFTASTNHTYAAPGVYNITVTVSDGTRTANRTLSINVTDDAAGPVVAQEPLTLSGSCSTGADDAPHTFDVLPGQPILVASIDIGGGGIDLDWSLLDPTGDEADGAASFTVAAEEDLTAEAPVEGTWSIAVTCFLGAAASYDIAVRFTDA